MRRSIRKSALAACLLAAAFSSKADVEIIDSKPMGQSAQAPARGGLSGASAEALSNSNAELYYQLQVLQQEVQELRGIVEQQSYEIKQLKKQRLDDYVDLDRRISQLYSKGISAGPGSSAPVGNTGGGNQSVSISPVQPQTSPADELGAYKSAIDLVIKKRDFDGGSRALQQYLQDFPSGTYVANAYYWLGQIHMQKGENEASQTWFNKMIEQFPNHSKTQEAKFKLAKLFFESGDTAKAQSLLQEVARSGSSSASMAKEFLEQNF